MQRWKEFFAQGQFFSNPFEGWRLALIERKGLDVCKRIATGSDRCWTVALTADGRLDPKNFEPLHSPLVDGGVMLLYDAEGRERAALLALTDTEYLLLSDPYDDVGHNPKVRCFYDAAGEQELAETVLVAIEGEVGRWGLVIADPGTPRDKAALIAVGGFRGAFVLRAVPLAQLADTLAECAEKPLLI